MNLTISVPTGSSNYGNPHLICSPPSWYDYILFFLTNYLAHVATIIALPGQSLSETICVAMGALISPSSGIMRALEIFIRHPALRKGNQLNKAAYAKALCMVVRVRPPVAEETGDNIKVYSTQYSWMSNLELVRERRDIHGQHYLPEGYAFAYVPPTAPLTLQKEAPEDISMLSIAGPYNLPKAIISLAQALWAIVTLYRSRGTQIEQYGYAAFGLTVAPYAYMSIINLTATCLTPEYPAIYMVRTSLMNEAEEKGGKIVGEVATLELDKVEPPEDPESTEDRALLLGFLLSLPPLAVVGGLSGFHAGKSTALERGFTMAWLAVGTAGGMWGYIGLVRLFQRDKMEASDSSTLILAFIIFAVIPLGAPAVGGFVVVGKMLKEYGVCTSLS